MSLDERAKFESLLAEYANAEMDCVRSSGRRHNAMHAILDYINDRTRKTINAALAEQLGQMPTGPSTAKPLHDAEIARGAKHSKEGTPVGDCSCITCCEARAFVREQAKADLRQIAETGNNLKPAPISDTSGGN